MEVAKSDVQSVEEKGAHAKPEKFRGAPGGSLTNSRDLQ